MKRKHALVVAIFSLTLVVAIALGKLYRVSYFALLPFTPGELMSCVFFIAVLTRQVLIRRSRASEEWTAGGNSRSLVGLAVALAAGGLAYSLTIPLFFNADDFDHLQLVRQPFLSSIGPQFTQGQAGGQGHIFYRPVGFLSLFVDYRLWHSWAPGYHLTNLSLYLICVAAVFFLCKELRLPSELCSTTALVFALLPANVQVVTWIACRFDQLATAFMVWAMVLSVRFRRTGNWFLYGGSILLFAMAAWSKESAYSLPLVWIALEFLPRDRGKRELIRPWMRWAPLAGYLGVSMLFFLQRWHLLGGIAGYAPPGGIPIIEEFGAQDVIAILVRAPGGMLLGYNFLQPPLVPVFGLLMVTGAMFLMLALLAEETAYSRRLIWLSLAWILASVIPVHFYFHDPADSVIYARGLYFGSAGLSLLIAVLLYGSFQRPIFRRVCTLALAVALVAGVEHNLGAWRTVSQITESFLTELRTLEPSPRQGAIFRIDDSPVLVRGVPFFTVGLESAVRFTYGWRTDITAEPLVQSAPAGCEDVICVAWWDGHTPNLRSPGELLHPKAFRISAGSGTAP